MAKESTICATPTDKRKELVSVPKNEYDRALAALSDCSKRFRSNYNIDDEEMNMIETAIKSQFETILAPDENFETRNGQYDDSTQELIKQAMELQNKINSSENGNDDEIDNILNVSSDDEDGHISLSSQSDDDGDETMDEEDLIDQGVYQKVKKIRSDLRKASIKLRETRENVMNKELLSLKQKLKILEGINEDMGDFNLDDDGETTLPNTDLSAMEDLLSSLKSNLDTLDVELPEKIQSLKETIESVSKSVQKKAEGKFSATERAIRARDDDTLWKSKGIRLGEGDSASNGEVGRKEMNPSSRLASFLLQSRIA